MKFNEKLIELRKKAGLSQEELGYKLNVTRQTVSKWELGLTTPEMEKLAEISKIFGISVDELINGTDATFEKNTVIEDQPIGNKNNTEKNQKMIGSILVVLVVLVLIIGVFSIYNKKKAEKEAQAAVLNSVQDIFGTATNIISDAANSQGDISEQTSNIISDISNMQGDILKQTMNIVSNQSSSTQEDVFEQATNIINDVSNMQADIINQAENMNNNSEDKNTFSEHDIFTFNMSFESYSGTRMGGTAIVVLDKVISSNKKEERKITVKYNEIETQNEDEIKDIKRNIDNFSDYEIFCDYDADGFINKVTIEKIK